MATVLWFCRRRLLPHLPQIGAFMLDLPLPLFTAWVGYVTFKGNLLGYPLNILQYPMLWILLLISRIFCVYGFVKTGARNTPGRVVGRKLTVTGNYRNVMGCQYVLYAQPALTVREAASPRIPANNIAP
jgi:hypothetical protein